MGRRYYRRRRSSSAGTLIRDSVEVSNRMPWWGAAIMGLVMFSFFYWIVPGWVHAQWEANQPHTESGRIMQNMIQHLLERRLHWVQYLGIALGLVGALFAVKNYFWSQHISRAGERGVGFFARIFGRWLD